MEIDRLSGGVIPLIFLVAMGTASAESVDPQQHVDEQKVQGQETLPPLRNKRTDLPTEAKASFELSAADRERIAERNRKATSGAPLTIGLLQRVDTAIAVGETGGEALTVHRDAESGLTTYTAKLDIEEAAGARVLLKPTNLPADAVISVFNDAGDTTQYRVGSGERFWTNTVTGSSVYVEIETAANAAEDAGVRIEAAMLIDGGSRAFCETNPSCIQDGSCHTQREWPAIDKARKAVAHINFIEDGWGYICSGALLADTDDDTTIPYFLTADHCVNDPDVAATVETWFNYKTPFCNAGCPPILPATASTLGATLLQHSAVDDHSLLALDEMPPADAWYLGWTSDPVAGADGTLAFRISHPNGSPQTYSAYRIDRGTSPTDYCATKTMSRGRFIVSRSLAGATDGGSSGAPLILGDGRVVGQLFGLCGYSVDDVCDFDSNVTMDGAFANYFDEVAQWLSPNEDGLPLTVQKLGTGEGLVRSSVDDGSDTAETSAAATAALLGSEPVEQSEWPWQAALKITTWRINGKWTCSGSVIAPTWILTAAHCIVDDIDERYNTVAPANIQVRTGSDHFEYGGQTSSVKRIVKHPEFDPITRDHDIALLELKSPVYVHPVRPVTWEREPTLACPGIMGAVTGWSDTDVCGQSSVVLSKVDTSIEDPDICRSAYGSTSITGNMLCTSSLIEDDTLCQEDDGAPLVVDNGRGGYTQAGIVSWGNSCETPDAPTVYTRLAPHVEWMEYVTGDDLSSDVGPGVIDCGSNCISQFAKDTLVTLTATAIPGSVFAGWDGACAGTESTCDVTMTQALNVKAMFNSAKLGARSCSN
ncbi:trypsin-like serine protease [Thiorhodococcus minor]|uniref:Trypsin-like serine protease n=1 Tax=Thiorhodococcus minor TaxID=57489 RepID=A0A6M0K5L4_9GAMM|nr:trypsin-like serine protease [Thiorhodococcus minor]NEV63887.1 trypsin-like serine protease [Thiorhodococcus minor]